ncbi:MAG: hypothetical protein I3273_02570 [Candidatus Moeniiplasma glomeromycotorum]|nr:hypothetical protein [Candidatus Moeniiplasma glomeromycotorum]MCE8167660.1 hypothetical protein [Candidatus Moeniiplasma glomeromycotorum]MCE8168989.1 hypothetical protein [Candidatus Moeniiplasma glomeromycotorum]
MKYEVKNGIKWVSCDNLGELITEFKKYRNSKSANERKSYSFGGIGNLMSMVSFGIVKHPNGSFSPSEIIKSAKVYQENGVDLSLNLAPLNLKEKDWTPYSKKVEKILKEVWETGEVKDYQGLDLNWPADSEKVCCDQRHKNIGNGKLAWFSDREKDLDFCSEVCYSKFKEQNILKYKEQLEKETRKKNIWVVISIAMISVFVLLLLLLILLRKRKKVKNNL